VLEPVGVAGQRGCLRQCGQRGEQRGAGVGGDVIDVRDPAGGGQLERQQRQHIRQRRDPGRGRISRRGYHPGAVQGDPVRDRQPQPCQPGFGPAGPAGAVQCLAAGLDQRRARDGIDLEHAGVDLHGVGQREIAELAKRARDDTLSLADLQGGTFTITNGGVFGSLLSTPILNAPQVGILGMHKIEQRPVVVNGQITIRPMMYVALSYDHRIVDGREAVQFLVRVKELVEDPETLLLEG